jgi:dTMP kinase
MSFITIEGGEGTGKSTLIRGLAEALKAQGRDVVQTREPGGSPGAEDIRALMVTGDADRWDAMTELLLVNAARRDHVERVVRPALARGATVLCDRYVDSTRCYQGMRGVPRALIDSVHHGAIDLDPDITLILDVPPEQGLARAADRGGDARFESMGLEYHTKLREAFLDIAKSEPQRCRTIDSTQPIASVLAEALSAIDA